ncbi:MAG: riboflavin synthase [Phycisphaerae bacterium]|nr:riboflavin synthase [Phycisphaerae bacterium]
MFTGLVQARGRVERLVASPAGVSLRVGAAAWGHRPSLGESIAVNGVCLTVAEDVGSDGTMRFDVVSETLSKTTLGRLREGAEVNLEHACRADSLLGGHIVQGHVDGVGRVAEVRGDAGDWRMEIELDAGLMPFIVPKGSVCVEGVSLTIASVADKSFGVALIPTTLEKTTLATLRAGDGVNIETDVVAKTVVNYLRHFVR